MTALRLLQVCNVGQIVGGTAACAWTVMRALPEFEHVVAFLSNVTDETRQVFQGARIERWPACTRRAVDEQRPDVVILHNIGGRERMSGSALTLQYVHSAGVRAPTDVTVCCSRWLAAQVGRSSSDVLYQGVPRPRIADGTRARGSDGRLVIGRVCTPTARKWPQSIIAFYAGLAAQFPDVEWEFVGCPPGLHLNLQAACAGRAQFQCAAWQARSRLWEWDALLYHNPDVTESFGRTVAEAMRAGCIPIVDARGGFVEQVTPETGFLCSTIEDYRQGVSMVQNLARRRQMSARGRAAADQRFSIARFRADLLARIREAATVGIVTSESATHKLRYRAPSSYRESET